MKSLHRVVALSLILMAAVLFGVGCGKLAADPEDHTGHDHGAEAEADVHDDEGPVEDHDDDEGQDEHDGHDDEEDHDERDGHEAGAEDHAEEERVELTAEQRRRIGLTLATAGPGSIGRDLSFPGEIALDPDRVAHVVPCALGIVREVGKTLGDTVSAGEILAWIESADLAQAKLEFFSREAEVGCCEIEVPRAREIFESVNRLLALLKSNPTEEAFRELAGLEMGDYRGKLITAYAGLVAAETAFDRERGLREKDISSGQDLVAAKSEFQRARAEFEASLDTARFEVVVAFGEAVRARQIAEFEAIAAEQNLRLKGVSDEEIGVLRSLVPKTAGLEPCLCTDPGCQDNEFPSLRESLGAEAKLGWYALRAPFAGVVIEKHLSLGEKVGEDESVFAVADTKTVWVNLSVFQKDLATIKPGQSVKVDIAGGGASHPGTIAYVSPIVDAETRTASARVVLANVDDAARPGLFVTVRVSLETVRAAVMVPREAVQILDEKEVIFIAEGDGFTAEPVTLGRGDRDSVEITSGLKAGQRYVMKGAFELKAKIATSGMDAHAGHGH
jgi:membrane fusion protein, heavy metal efflux system